MHADNAAATRTSPCHTSIEFNIGVVKDKGGYDLSCDFYDHNIEKVIGRKGGLLKQAYAVAKTKIEARKKGYSVLEQNTDTGVRLHIRLNQ